MVYRNIAYFILKHDTVFSLIGQNIICVFVVASRIHVILFTCLRVAQIGEVQRLPQHFQRRIPPPLSPSPIPLPHPHSPPPTSFPTYFSIPYDTYGLLTKCEVKMAGYWPSFFLRVYGPRRSRGP